MNLIRRAINALRPAKKDLTEPVAPPSLIGARNIWRPRANSGITPAQLKAKLSAAALGDADAYLTIAEEMEETDPHYASVLGTRKRAVLGLPRLVESASDAPEDVKLADAVRDYLLTPKLSALLAALLDAIGKGYSVVELGWDTTSTPWIPTYTWRDPRFFRYDRETGQTLRLLDDSHSFDGIDLPPYRFIVHTPQIKMGLPIRGGMAWLCAITSLCAIIAKENWLSYAESYGAPVRVAKADDRHFAGNADSASAQLLTGLRDAMKEMLGQDAYAVLPKSVDIELQSASPGSSDMYERLVDALNKQVSKAVLGRSDAADATSGKLGGETAQSEVRRDILESDAEELTATINAQLVKPFIDLNFGPQERYPTLKLYVPDQEDLAGLVDMLAKLVPLGLRVEQSIIRDKFGLPDPEDGAELLGGAPAVTPPPALPPATNRAINRSLPAPIAPDPTAPLVERLGTEAEPLLQTLLAPVQAALADSSDLMDFRAKLLDLYPDLDGKSFAELMGQALAVADAQGRWEAQPPMPAANQITIVMPSPDETERELSRHLLNELLRK